MASSLRSLPRFCLLLVALLPAGLFASCQTTRPAYAFQFKAAAAFPKPSPALPTVVPAAPRIFRRQPANLPTQFAHRKSKLPPSTRRHSPDNLSSVQLLTQLPAATNPAEPSQPAAATPTIVKAGLLFLLSGVLLAGGGIVLGLGLGGLGGLLTGAAGLLAGVLLGMMGLFSVLSHTTNTYFRFTLPVLLGAVVGVAGLAGGLYLGGVLGAGLSLGALGLGGLLVGIGVLTGSEPRNPSPAPPVTP